MAEAKTGIKPPFLMRAAAAVQWTISGVSPSSWFGPLQPLPPMAPADVKGRAFDYLFGWNLQYIPRASEAVSFATIRNAIDNCDVARLLIETRKDRMAVLDWTVRPKEIEPGKRPSAAKFKAKIDAINSMLKSPDRLRDWGQWIRDALDQNLVYDSLAIYRRKTRSGKPYSWEVMDGTKFKVLLDASGRRPAAPSPAYQQVLKGLPAVDYTSEELLYWPENPRVERGGYGYPRVEQCLRYINLQLARTRAQLGWYTDGNVPEGFIEAPEDVSVEQVSALQNWWDSNVLGPSAIELRRRVWWLPKGSKYQPMKEAVLKSEFDEWIARVLCFAFSEDPTPFVRQTNRATAESAQLKAESEGLLPSMLYVRRFMNRLIEVDFEAPELEFAWDLDLEFDPAKKAVIETTYVKAGVKSIDEAREGLGLDVLGGAFSKPMAFTATGYMPVDPKEQTAIIQDRQPVQVAPGPDGETGAAAAKKPAPAAAGGRATTSARGEGSSAAAQGSKAKDKQSGKDTEKFEVSRPILNAPEIHEWLGKLAIAGDRVEFDELRCSVGIGHEDASQPAALFVEKGARAIRNLPDGRLALYFESPELDARRAEVSGDDFDPSWQPHVVLSKGPAVLKVDVDSFEKAAAPLLAEDAVRALVRKGREAMSAWLVEHGAEKKTLDKLDDGEVEKSFRSRANAPGVGEIGGRVEASTSEPAPYGGSILLGNEEYKTTLPALPNPNVETSVDEVNHGLLTVAKVSRAEVDAAAAEAHPSPSAAQTSAGNYRHGHVVVHGLGISIENAKGSKRKGFGRDGKSWSVVMPAHYGYVKRTEGADGDHVDVYVGPNPESTTVWVVDQIDRETGDFDEHKVMLGYDSWAAASKDYVGAFSDGKGAERIGHVSSMTISDFKSWLAEGPRTAPKSMTEKIAKVEYPDWVVDICEAFGFKPEELGLEDIGRAATTIAKIDRPHKEKHGKDVWVVEVDGHVYGKHANDGAANRQIAALFAAKEKSVTVGTGLHGHDQYGDEPSDGRGVVIAAGPIKLSELRARGVRVEKTIRWPRY